MTDQDKTRDQLIDELEDLRRKVAELERAGAQFVGTEKMLELAPVVFVALNRKGEVTFINKQGESLLGLSRDQILGRDWFDNFLPEQDRDRVKNVFFKVLRGEMTASKAFENPVLAANGEERLISWHNIILRNGLGEAVGTLSSGVDITARRRAEGEVAKERNFSTFILDSLPGTFYVFDSQGKIMRWNSFLERTSGYSSEEIGSMHVLDFFHDDEKPKLRHAVQEVFTKGETQVEADWVTREGKRISYYFNARRIHVEGKPYLIGVGIDISDRKRAEEALRESEERYRLLAEDSPLGIFIHQDEHFVYANRRMADIFGYTTDELTKMKFWEVALPKYREVVRARGLARYEGADGADRYEGPVICRNGKTKWVEVSAARCTYRGRAAVLGTFVDISEKKNAVDALVKSEALMKAILNGINTNIAFVDKDMKIMWVNKAAADSVSRDASGMMGRKCHEFWADPAKPCEGCPTVMAFKTGKAHHTEMVTPDSRVWDESGEPVFDAQGRLIGVVEIAHDVTERKKSEQERESLRAQLFQSQKMEAIGTLAGGIAHDFNNLLTVVIGFTELLLLEKDRDHPEYADLQKILRAAKNGADLVQRLLTFGRKTDPKPLPLNLNRQILQVEKILRRTIPKMIDIQLHLSPGTPEVCADTSQLEQVLLNLAVNARDAMHDGGSLTVTTEKVLLDDDFCRLHVGANPGEYALLAVSDTGNGMTKETLEHIFEPFFTTKEMGRGTGLGLAMVHGIVNRHNGYITCESEIGRGTTFKTYLPAIPTDQDTEDDISGRAAAFGTETILLVDDEEFVRDLGARILTRYGYTVLQAANGKEAIEVFREKGPEISLVILDLIMPEMSGSECMEQLLKIDPKAGIVLSSGYSADSPMGESVEMGARGFVQKPFRMRDLLQEVRRVLDKT